MQSLFITAALMCSFLSAQNSFAANINFTGQVLPPVLISTDAFGHNHIHFQIKINNVGTDNYSGPLDIRPFALSSDELSAAREAEVQSSVVLEQFNSNVSVPAQGSTVVDYDAALPRMRMAPYLVSAFINNTAKVAETDTMDNIVDLVDAGTFEVTSAAPVIPGPIDLVSYFNGDPRTSAGGIVTYLRTVVYGTNGLFPGALGSSNALWARFMVADLASKKIYTAPYKSYGGNTFVSCPRDPALTDKNWFAISYANEHSSDGRQQWVDYYSQAPCFADIPPGKYRLLTLMNSRNLVQEVDHSNNMDVIPLDITPVTIDNLPREMWIVQTGAAQTFTSKLKFHTNYMQNYNFTVNTNGDLPNFSVDVANGALGGSSGPNFGKELNFAWAAGEGNSSNSGEIVLNYDLFPNASQHIPVRLFSFANGTAPALELPATTATVVVKQAAAPVAGSFQIKNTGNAPMVWKAEGTDSWVELAQTSGVIQPGESAPLLFTVHQSRLGNNRSGGSKINLLTNTATTLSSLTVTLQWQQ